MPALGASLAQRASDAAAAWTVYGASVRGAAHVRAGLPNQDGLAIAAPAPGTAAPAIAVVADGHGGARHFRSATGAQLAVAAARDVLAALAPRIEVATDAERERIVQDELPSRVVAQWRAAADAHRAREPVTAEEWAQVEATDGAEARASVEAEPILAYGATVLAALVTARFVVLAQLGDGDVLAVDASGTTTRPIPGDDRLIGNFTTSLCRDGAAGDFRTALVRLDRAGVALLVLATDGYANSFRSDADFLLVGRDLAAMLRASGPERLAAELPAILADASRDGSGDDITVALLHPASPATGAAAFPPGSAPGSAPDPAAAVGPQRTTTLRADVTRLERDNRRLKRGILVVLLVATVAIATSVERLRGRPEPVASDKPPLAAPAPAPNAGSSRPLRPVPRDGETAPRAPQSEPVMLRPRSVAA